MPILSLKKEGKITRLLPSPQQDFSLKELLTDDDMFVVTRVFWCAVCLAESDLEHEFGFAVRMLSCMLVCETQENI